MSLLLVAAISSPTLASEPNSVPVQVKPVVSKKVEVNPQETWGDYWKVFEGELNKEINRNDIRLKYLREESIIQDYIFERTYDSFHNLSREESEIIEDYVWDVLEDSGKEFIDNVDCINEMENNFKKMFSYEVAGKTGDGKRNGHYSPDFAEEERKEDLRQEEVTSAEGLLSRYLGKGYEFHSGFKSSVRHMRPVLTAYSRLENFHLAGIPFRKAKLDISSDEKVKFRLYKVLNDDWSLSLSAREDFKKDRSNISLSLSKAFKNPRSQLSFSVSQRDGNETYVGVGYTAKF